MNFKLSFYSFLAPVDACILAVSQSGSRKASHPEVANKTSVHKGQRMIVVSFNHYLLNIESEPCTLLRIENAAVDKKGKVPFFWENIFCKLAGIVYDNEMAPNHNTSLWQKQ